MTELIDVTIIVHSARGLQGRKSGRCKFSVIFGVGNRKFRTAVIKDHLGNPDFNEDIVIHSVHPDETVFFTVTEKDDILGHISVPVSCLQPNKGRILRAVLLPHRKCPKPQGELIYQCYFSQSSNSNSQIINATPSVTSTPPRLLPKRLHKHKHSDSTGNGSDRHGHKHGALTTLNKKFSKSLHDIINFAKNLADFGDDEDSSLKTREFRATSTNYMDEIGQRPVLTAITPCEAPTMGGTQLVIIGRHLGMDLADIVQFKLCGCDLLDTVKYESPMRLYCTTKAWNAQKGDFILETTSGGFLSVTSAFAFSDDRKTSTLSQNRRMSSSNVYPGNTLEKVNNSLNEDKTLSPRSSNGSVPSPSITITEHDATPNLSANNSLVGNPAVDVPDGKIESMTDSTKKTKNKGRAAGLVSRHVRHSSETIPPGVRPSQMPEWSKEELKKEVIRLEQENIALKQENQDRKAYIDHLLEKVMQYCPQALES